MGAFFIRRNSAILEVAEIFLEVGAPILAGLRGFLETSLHLLENQNYASAQPIKDRIPPQLCEEIRPFSFQMYKPRYHHR